MAEIDWPVAILLRIDGKDSPLKSTDGVIGDQDYRDLEEVIDRVVSKISKIPELEYVIVRKVTL